MVFCCNAGTVRVERAPAAAGAAPAQAITLAVRTCAGQGSEQSRIEHGIFAPEMTLVSADSSLAPRRAREPERAPEYRGSWVSALGSPWYTMPGPVANGLEGGLEL